MKISKLILVITICLSSLMTNSCREEIFSPFDNLGEKNSFFYTNYNSVFRFEVEADDFTVNFNDTLKMNSLYTRILITATNHKTGTADVNLRSEQGSNLYSRTIIKDIDEDYLKQSDYRPSKIEIAFRNFTGKLKIEIRAYYF